METHISTQDYLITTQLVSFKMKINTVKRNGHLTVQESKASAFERLLSA